MASQSSSKTKPGPFSAGNLPFRKDKSGGHDDVPFKKMFHVLIAVIQIGYCRRHLVCGTVGDAGFMQTQHNKIRSVIAADIVGIVGRKANKEGQ